MMNVFTLFSQTKGIILDAYDTPINEVAIFLSRSKHHNIQQQ